MTVTVFLHRVDTNLIDTGYMYRLDDFYRRKPASVGSSFLVGPKHNLLDVARTALAKPNVVDE